jgi:hypothetical protein
MAGNKYSPTLINNADNLKCSIIKKTSQGCPSEAGGKIYYFNYSSYCFGYILIAGFVGFFSKLIVITANLSI